MNRLSAATVLQLHALHAIARIAVRALPPLRAKRLVALAAWRRIVLTDVDQARSGAACLEGHGTCLTRAIALAAAVPSADVVIGIDAWASARIAAHAWIEVGGERVDTSSRSDGFHEEIARLPAERRHAGGARDWA